MKEDIRKKLMSRKFWVAVAVVIMTLGIGIASVYMENNPIAIVSLFCCMLIASIYEVCETTVDIARLDNEYEDEENKEDK